MPGTKEVLQNLRKSASVRTIPLTSEEIALVPPQDGEICLSVYGTMTDKGFQVSRVEPEAVEEDQDSEDVSGPPDRAMPSPS